VILDVCYAAAVQDIPGWCDRFAPVTLLAAGRSDKTYQFEPVRRMPIDVRKRYPQAQDWAQMHLGPQWDRHVSFLGLMWMAATVQTDAPPGDKVQWVRFLENCSQAATDFRRTKGCRWASTVQTFCTDK